MKSQPPHFWQNRSEVGRPVLFSFDVQGLSYLVPTKLGCAFAGQPKAAVPTLVSCY